LLCIANGLSGFVSHVRDGSFMNADAAYDHLARQIPARPEEKVLVFINGGN